MSTSRKPSTLRTIGIGGQRVHFLQPPWCGIEYRDNPIKLQPNQYSVVHRLASTWPKGVDEAELVRSIWGASARERGCYGLADSQDDSLPKAGNGVPDDTRVALIKLVNRINDTFAVRGIPLRIETVRPADVVGARYYKLALSLGGGAS